MKKGMKVLLVLGVIFAVLYFTGAGSILFNNYETNAEDGGQYISKIRMQVEQETVHEDIFKDYAILLTRRFRFDNGVVSHIPYFYGAKADEINPVSGLETKFGTMAWGTGPSGNQFFEMYGLDCSGYTSYVMYLCGIRGFPNGSANQYLIGASIPIEQAQTGDFLIYRDATTNQITHIGYVIEDNGTLFDIHCNAADDGIKGRELSGIGTKADGFYWQEVVKNPYVTHD